MEEYKFIRHGKPGTFQKIHLLYFAGICKVKAWCLLVTAISLLTSSCSYSYFYKAVTQTSPPDTAVQRSLQMPDKYFILHAQNGNYGLKNSTLGDNRIEASLETLDTNHNKYLYPKPNSSNRYRKRNEPYVLREVHLYTTAESLSDTQRISLPLRSVKRIDNYQKDTKRTKKNHILFVIGTTAWVAAIVGSIIVGTGMDYPDCILGQCQ
jgi:hypothetical protein